MKFYIAALAVAVMLIFLRSARNGLRVEEQQRDWVEGWAEVLKIEELPTSPNWIGEGGMVGLFAVRARLRTRDGREAIGWADGEYSRRTAKAWLGHTVQAWHDPQDPSRFRLRPPQSPSEARQGIVIPFLIVAFAVGFVITVITLVP